MSKDTPHSHKKEYFIIFAVLTVLTAIEIAIPEMKSLTRTAINASLFALAMIKAFVVAYWFMHLKDESRWLKFIAAVPLSAFIYALVVILESIYR